MVCLRRQEPRAGDVQDERLFTGCDVDRHKQERLSAMTTVINRKLCMQAKAGAESLPARGEGVGMDDGIIHLKFFFVCVGIGAGVCHTVCPVPFHLDPDP